MANLGGPTFWIILLVIILLFGAAKLPALAKSLGQSARVFKSEVSQMKEEDDVKRVEKDVKKTEKAAEKAADDAADDAA